MYVIVYISKVLLQCIQGLWKMRSVLWYVAFSWIELKSVCFMELFILDLYGIQESNKLFDFVYFSHFQLMHLQLEVSLPWY